LSSVGGSADSGLTFHIRRVPERVAHIRDVRVLEQDDHLTKPITQTRHRDCCHNIGSDSCSRLARSLPAVPPLLPAFVVGTLMCPILVPPRGERRDCVIPSACPGRRPAL
jgi:hypothetical protein